MTHIVQGRLQRSTRRAFFHFVDPAPGNRRLNLPVEVPGARLAHLPERCDAQGELARSDHPWARMRFSRTRSWEITPSDRWEIREVVAEGHRLQGCAARRAAFGSLRAVLSQISQEISANFGVSHHRATRAEVLAASDLGSIQRVEDYLRPENQRRYVHMYAAKHIAAWRTIRALLDWTCRDWTEPLFSIGAGPGLDLMGWGFDRRWPGPIHALDPIPWAVVDDPGWRAALETFAGSDPVVEAGWYVPSGEAPDQLAGVDLRRGIDLSTLPAPSTVLLPFVINHLDGAVRCRFVAQIERARQRGVRMVMCDAHTWRGPTWPGLLRGLGVSDEPQPLRFQPMLDRLASLYPAQDRPYRTGRTCRRFAEVRVLVGDAQGWYFLTAPGDPS